MRETWFVLEDDEVVDPAEVSTLDSGRLIHSSGVMVAMRGNVPHSRGVDDPDAARAAAQEERDSAARSTKAKAADQAPPASTSKEAPETAQEPPKATREMTTAKPKGNYKTRGGKAD